MLGSWSAKAEWGGIGDLVSSACITLRLRAGERRLLAAHLPPGHRACLQTGKLGDLPYLTSAYFKARPHVISAHRKLYLHAPSGGGGGMGPTARAGADVKPFTSDERCKWETKGDREPRERTGEWGRGVEKTPKTNMPWVIVT